MSDPGGRRPRSGMSNQIASRLWRTRWPLGTALVAFPAAAVFGGGSLTAALAGFAVVAVVTALAPLRTTAERRVESALAARPRSDIKRLKANDIMRAVSDPLIVFDRTGSVVHANPAAASAFGPLPEGTSLRLKFRAPEMQALIETVLERPDTVQPIDYGEKIPLEKLYRVGAGPLGEADGLYVLTFRDQSEARRIDRMRADFIANASHELRTPLASITGFIETLRGPARDDAKTRDNFLQIMQDQTARMARLIDDLLSLSRLETKPYLRPGETVDLAQLVKGVADSMRHQAREAGVAIEIEAPDDPVHAAGERDELIQVFENLVENACKYGHSGGRIVLSVARTPDDVEHDVSVTVRDFGQGIAEEHLPRITERFYRVDVETSRARKGTGLGLSIVKHILGRHDARLSVRSKPGEGAAFIVHLHAR